MQRFLVAQRELEAEEGRITEALAAADQRLQQIGIDVARETALGEDAEATLRRLDEEVAAIEVAREGEGERREQARAALEEITQVLHKKEGELAEQTQTVAAAEANRDALINRRDELGRRHASLAERIKSLQQERGELLSEMGADSTLPGMRGGRYAGRGCRRGRAPDGGRSGGDTWCRRADEADRRARLREAQSARDRLRAEKVRWPIC